MKHAARRFEYRKLLTLLNRLQQPCNDYVKDLDGRLETWSGERLAIVRSQATQIAKEVAHNAASHSTTVFCRLSTAGSIILPRRMHVIFAIEKLDDRWNGLAQA